MPHTTDESVHDLLAGGITLLLVAGALALALGRVRGRRPDLAIAWPVAVAFAIRVLATAGVSLTGIGTSLRGGDEIGFLTQAHEIAAVPFAGEAWTDALTGALYNFVFAGQIGLLDSPEFVLRITQAGIAVGGLLLVALAVYELAGARAATLSMWFLALEPTNIFFSTLLHKEANMILATGLVVYGAARLWRHSDLRALLPIVFGCLIGLATRPYAGWFLVAAAAICTLHAGLRREHRSSGRGLTAVAIVVVFAVIAVPTAIDATNEKSLEGLQSSQTANTNDPDANLALEEVNYSSRGAILTSLPTRIGDVLFRPYPWQVDNTSQQLGLLGTLVALGLLALLIRELILSRGAIMERAGPLIYLLFCLLVAYSLSAGNAGTAFRYRTHLVAVAGCALVALWSARRQEEDRVVEKPDSRARSRELLSTA